MSAAEARRMRLGSLLPAALILPMAAMFGFDQSKSQPSHFLLVFSVAICLSAAVVSISWYGAKRRIAEFSKTKLETLTDRLVWHSTLGTSELLFEDIASVSIQKTRGNVRTIVLRRTTGSHATLEGYESMDEIAEHLAAQLDAKTSTSNSWISV